MTAATGHRGGYTHNSVKKCIATLTPTHPKAGHRGGYTHNNVKKCIATLTPTHPKKGHRGGYTHNSDKICLDQIWIKYGSNIDQI
jgi:hypothetical protein